jgi:predicted DNA-binding protein
MLSRRLQIKLDDDRYERISRRARDDGTSVAAVVRQAIDRGVPDVSESRSGAAQAVLEAPAMEVPDDPTDLRPER